MNFRFNPISDARRKFVQDKLAGKLSLQEIDQYLVPLDPSSTGEYLSWIANLVAQGLKYVEDAEILKNALNKYHQLKENGQLVSVDRNIFNFKTHNDLYKRLDKYTVSETRPVDNTPLEKVATIRDLEIFHVKNVETLQKLSRDTHWCTSNEGLAIIYLTYGKVFLVTKKGKKYALIHFSNYSEIYREYESVVNKFGELFSRGIDPYSGEDLKNRHQEFRPELKGFFDTPTIELATKKITSFTNLPLLSAQAYFREIADRILLPVTSYHLPKPEFQIRDTYDRLLPINYRNILLRWALKTYTPTIDDSAYHYLDYFKAMVDEVRIRGSSITTEDLFKVMRTIERKSPNLAVEAIKYVFNPRADESYLTHSERGKFPKLKRDFIKYLNSHSPSWLTDDPETVKNFYEVTQGFLAPNHKQKLEKKILKFHQPDKFEFPKHHYLEYYYRIDLERSLQDYQSEVSAIEEGFESNKKSHYISELNLAQADLTSITLREAEGIKKQAIPAFKRNISVLRKSWDNFVEITNNIINKSDMMPLSDLVLRIIKAYKKSGLKNLDFPLRKDNKKLGPNRQTLWEQPYLIYDAQPTLLDVIERLTKARSETGMVEHKGRFWTPRTFLNLILQPAKMESNWKRLNRLARLREKKKVIEKQRTLIERVEKEFPRSNPFVRWSGDITDHTHSIYKDIYEWLRSYGLGTRGFTVIGADSLRKKLAKQVGEKKMKTMLPIGLLGGILITCRSYDNLCNILEQKEDDSVGFQNIRKRWYSNDPRADEKMKVVKEKLHEELSNMIDKERLELRQKLPVVFKPNDKHHYKAENYYIYPIYLAT